LVPRHFARSVGSIVHLRNGSRNTFFASDPEALRSAEGEEAGHVEVLRAAGQEVGVPVVEDTSEAEASGVDGGGVNRIAGDRTGSSGNGAGVAEGGDGDGRGAGDGLYFCGVDEFDEREDVVRALGEDGVVVAEGVGGRLAFVFNDAGLLQWLAVFEEF